MYSYGSAYGYQLKYKKEEIQFYKKVNKVMIKILNSIKNQKKSKSHIKKNPADKVSVVKSSEILIKNPLSTPKPLKSRLKLIK